jgi:alanyl-tRNA synthetase
MSSRRRRRRPQALAASAVPTAGGAKVLVSELPDVDAKAMQEAAQKLQAALGDSGAVVLGTRAGDRVNFVAAFGPGVVKAGQQAGKVVGAVAKVCGGGGGGKPQLAQAGGKDPSKFEEALELARSTLMGRL